MGGIYIHIPFCRDKCSYCDFFSGNQLYLIDSYVDALIKEVNLRADYLPDKKIGTIYFGGGTPSLLSSDHLAKILKAVHANFMVNTNAEITMECNPEDIDSVYVSNLYDIGVNRISLGIQFLDDAMLLKFNRKHSRKLIFKSLEILNNSRLTNLSIDLIYAVPDIFDIVLRDSLEELLRFDIKHVSAYSLTIAKNSQLFWKIERGEFVEGSDELFLSQYEIIRSYLESRGFQHYEVSNYALEGFYSAHNLAYWNQIPYLGIGVAAHSYDLVSRRWNRTSIKRYITELEDEQPKVSCEFEQLSINQLYNEYIILKLRTFQGLSLKYINENFGANLYSHFLEKVEILKDANHFIYKGDLIISKESDLLIGDYLAKVLMY